MCLVSSRAGSILHRFISASTNNGCCPEASGLISSMNVPSGPSSFLTWTITIASALHKLNEECINSWVCGTSKSKFKPSGSQEIGSGAKTASHEPTTISLIITTCG